MTDTDVRQFVHLHCHSHYSLLDGASSIDRLVDRAREQGMNALAITDHGNLHGALEFYRKSKANDLNPIIGYEAYVAPQSRFDKKVIEGRESSYHLTLLARNRTGFRNLLKLASAAYLEGFYHKPRIDRELLAEHHEGLICLSGCLSGEFAWALRTGKADDGEMSEAEAIAGWFARVFPGRYYIEIMNNGMRLQQEVTERSVEIARRLGLPLVATCDSHYVDREDAELQDVLLCINTGKFRADTNRMRMDGQEYYLKSPEEMYAAFSGLEDAVARTQEIADSVEIELELGKRHFPTYPIPAGKTADQLLRELCERGLKERYAGDEEMCPGGELAPRVMERLDRELSVISKLGFSNYFLIVWDFVRQAREQGIPATARGSGVGAIVCFALYLSHVCPLKYGLLFERFLDENRLEAPDIDIDFCKEWRSEIIHYVKEKYGEANVAQIGTFGTLQARQAIKDVARVLGLPLSRVTPITAMVPEAPKMTIQKALEISDDLRKAYEENGEVREVIDLARRLEGLARNVGTHAAAVVIADRPLTDYVPLCRVSGKDDVITQWSMGDVEAAGLLKMDFLGLRNLTILRKAVAMIEQTRGEKIDIYRLPLDDPDTYALLCRGETKGVFQLESGGIRDLLQKMKPDHFRDIIATNALYRPGPLEGGMVQEYIDVKHGRKQASYLHPILEEILEETHGVMVYQEQVMQILNRLGDIPLAAAYTCIKAISKKKEALIRKNKDEFLKGATAKGVAKSQAERLWEMIEKFAGYGFNKSHSTAYALVAYQTAYLKTHYSLEFMAALLSGDIPGRNFKTKDSLVEHLDDCRRMGIEVVAPDINRSDVEFAVADGKIYFGLAAIKSCGGKAAEGIVAERRANGPFRDLYDFCERIDSSVCNRTAIEMLIKAGACDSWCSNRGRLLAGVDGALQAGAKAQKDRKTGQRSLFGDLASPPAAAEADLPDVPDLPERERLLAEREALGFYLSSHPLAEYESTFAEVGCRTTADIAEVPDRGEIILGGMLAAIKHAHVKRTRPGSTATKYVNFDLEDRAGSVRCILWPDDYEIYGQLVQPDAILVVRGVVDRRGGDEANLIVNELIPLDQLQSRCTRGLRIIIEEKRHDEETLKRLREILRYYPGRQSVELLIVLEDDSRVLLKSEMKVAISSELRTRVDELLGGVGHQLLMTRPQTGQRHRSRRGRQAART